MNKALVLSALLLVGCSNNPSSPSGPTPTPTPSNAGNIYFNWTESPSVHGCSMVWKIDGGSPVTVGSASVTQGDIVLWTWVAYGIHTVNFQGYLSGPLTLSNPQATIIMGTACSSPTTFTVSVP